MRYPAHRGPSILRPGDGAGSSRPHTTICGIMIWARSRCFSTCRQLRARCRLSHSPQSAARSSCRSEEHTSELQSLMRISYAVFCLKKKKKTKQITKLKNKDKNTELKPSII